MKFLDALLEKFNIELSDGAKTVLIIVAGLILALIAFGVLKSMWRDYAYKGGVMMGGVGMPPINMTAPDSAPWQGVADGKGGGGMMQWTDAGYAGSEEAEFYAADAPMPMFSARNAAAIYPPMPGYSTGNTAEMFEVSDYSASIETNRLAETCAGVAALKTRGDVIFESAWEGDVACTYTFKAEHAAVPYVLQAIKALNPRDITENTYTIKEQLDDFTSEADILEKKLAAIEETLTDALAAYEEVAELAASANDAEALARVVSSKVATIERLTQERINISQQLQYLARAKEQQADKLLYSFFSVSVYENQYIDGQGLADSWKMALQQFFFDVNRMIQGITISLIALILWAVQYLLYFLLVVVIVRVGWTFAKRIWER